MILFGLKLNVHLHFLQRPLMLSMTTSSKMLKNVRDKTFMHS